MCAAVLRFTNSEVEAKCVLLRSSSHGLSVLDIVKHALRTIIATRSAKHGIFDSGMVTLILCPRVFRQLADTIRSSRVFLFFFPARLHVHQGKLEW